MPYKFQTDKLLIPKKRGVDNRICFTEDDKENIKKLFKGGMAVGAIARLYKSQCSRASIIFLLYPERAERAKIARRAKGQMYYNTEKNRKYAKKHRDHKKELYKKGLLVGGKE